MASTWQQSFNSTSTHTNEHRISPHHEPAHRQVYCEFENVVLPIGSTGLITLSAKHHANVVVLIRDQITATVNRNIVLPDPQKFVGKWIEIRWLGYDAETPAGTYKFTLPGAAAHLLLGTVTFYRPTVTGRLMTSVEPSTDNTTLHTLLTELPIGGSYARFTSVGKTWIVDESIILPDSA